MLYESDIPQSEDVRQWLWDTLEKLISMAADTFLLGGYRNRCMVDDTDFVVACVPRSWDGAAQTMDICAAEKESNPPISETIDCTYFKERR